MAASLKAMWSLLNVMQVVAYLRHIENNPANLQTILTSLDNAITLEPIKSAVKDYGKDKYDVAKSKVSNEELNKGGIDNTSLFWSLGFFAIAFVVLALMFGLYYLVKTLRKKCSHFGTVEKILKKKLFFSSAIRYMIQGNLKLTHTAIFYIAVTGLQFNSVENSAQTVINILIIVLLVAWPIFLAVFLTANRSKLDTAEFQQKYDSMFLGYKTDHYLWKDRTNWSPTTMCFLYI